MPRSFMISTRASSRARALTALLLVLKALVSWTTRLTLLTAWANEGVDIHAKLPVLSAYLGHLNIIGTEVYLKATPQLLELASNRFEQHLRDARSPQ